MGQACRFGAFCVDPVRRILLRDGEIVPITPKAFSILLLLIESRSQIVAKEELIQGAWSGAQVSDANLMQNISSLRKALGERAGDSRYIVTIPGQGYRFAGELVEMADEEPAGLPEPTASPAVPSPPSPPLPALESPVTATPRRVLFPILGAVLFLLIAITLVVWRQGTQARPVAASRPGVAVLDLRNLSGNPKADWLGPELAEMLAAELATGGRVRVISGESVARARRSLGDPPPQSLDAVFLQKLHGLLGADLIIDGAYLALPGKRPGEGAPSLRARVRLDLRVLSVPGGDVVASLAEVGEEHDLAGLVARTGTRLRRFPGLADLTRSAPPPAPGTPPAAAPPPAP